jgi:hypothetical protein
VVTEALKSIPEESQFYQCMNDVIGWYHEYPGDWKRTWFEVEKKWSADVGCPDGVFKDFNIDAKINAAYILIGLLYGEEDFSKTMEISTRCGQDSDCNPASAGGILGVMLGYSNIPEFWKKPVYPVEDMDFKYTTMSLNDVYEIGTKHALAVLEQNGANIQDDVIEIPVQNIQAVKLEVGFEGHYPVERVPARKTLNAKSPEFTLTFSGNGFALQGWAKSNDDKEEIDIEVTVDEGNPERFTMPTAFQTRKHELAWKYQLPEGEHKVTVKMLNQNPGMWVDVGDLIVYSSNKIENTWKTH